MNYDDINHKYKIEYDKVLIALFKDYDSIVCGIKLTHKCHYSRIQNMWKKMRISHLYEHEDYREQLEHLGYYPDLLMKNTSPYWRRMCDWKMFKRKREQEFYFRKFFINFTYTSAIEYHNDRKKSLYIHQNNFKSVLEDIKKISRGFNAFVIFTKKDNTHFLNSQVDVLLHIQKFI